MISNPVSVSTQVAMVVETSEKNRYVVLVYVDGRLTEAHPPMSRDEAEQRKANVISGDR